MSVINIIQYPDPTLRQSALPVEHFDSTLDGLVKSLVDTLKATTGIGLCAPQLGHSRQLLAMDLSDNKTETQILINPVIVSRTGLAICEEQCLSIPGIAAKVIRAGTVQVQASDERGQAIDRQYQGMEAVCIQHEIDHLQGKLFIDRVSRLRQFWFRKTLTALESNSPAAMFQHC